MIPTVPNCLITACRFFIAHVCFHQKNGEVDAEDNREVTLEELLEKLGLQDYIDAFKKEEIDMEAFVRQYLFIRITC